jgi:hypothetical protein
METTGVLGATYLATDGYLDPSGLTYAFATAPRGPACRSTPARR